MKFLYHLFIFAIGVGLGIWIGVKYPAQGKEVADTESQQASKIQAAVNQGKIDLLDKLMNSNSAQQNESAFKQMLSDEKQKLQTTATTSLGN